MAPLGVAKSCVAESSAAGAAKGNGPSRTAYQQRQQADEFLHVMERPFDFTEDALIEDGDDEPDSRPYHAQLPDSFFSRPQGLDNEESIEEPWDAVTMISTISQVYRRGIYIKMFTLDHTRWETLGQGATFQVSRSDIDFNAVSSRNNRVKERVSNKLILKRTFGESLASTDIRSFVGELRILHHLQDHPFIVDLRGIGWFYHFSHPDLIRTPQPALLLEEADNTLDHLVGPDVSIAYEGKLKILAQIASALVALHASGVAHGDVKPSNVLLFPFVATKEGVLVNSYTAKLSDFGSAVFDTGLDQPFPRGTRGYTAPEVDFAVETGLDGADFEAILQTDVWSFGILAAVVICSSHTILAQSPSPESRARSIFSRIRGGLESSTTEFAVMQDVQALLSLSLQVEPIFRRLDVIVETLKKYDSDSNSQSFEYPGKLPGTLAAHLTVSYENFKPLGGPIKDFIVRELEAVTALHDARLPMALWELGVIHLSQFANPDSSIERGLECIRRSAESGDPRAKALAHRLHEAFERREVCEISHHTRIQWLQDAACAGSFLARAELGALDASLAEKAWTIYAASCYDTLITNVTDLCDVSLPVSERDDSALHRAAATGRVFDVEFLLTNTSIDINYGNLDGETPLLSACRFGQLDTALLLLRNGANASLTNKLGENSLHFAWCFDTGSSQLIVDELIARGASLGAKARARYAFSALDVLPLPSGTPIQRAAARRRLDLVLLFQRHENSINPGNGNTARRMLLWALRLHDIDTLEFILDFSTRHSSCKPGLAPIVNTEWLHQGEQRSLLKAACGGWISGTNNGCDLPLHFWLACCFGKEWKMVIRRSIALYVEFLVIYDLDSERKMDDAITWAFQNSCYDTMAALLHLKFEKTSGQRSRLHNYDALKWNLNAINVSVKYVMRPQEAHLIDLIFFDTRHGTLAQQAFLSGDRYMFRLLTRRYRANAALPAPAPVPQWQGLAGQTTILGSKMNLYSVLAYTTHRDTWFADELQRLRILPTCPWDSLPVDSVVALDDGDLHDIFYMPSLLHAVSTNSWAYVFWLIGSGSSLEEKVTPELDILGAIMATRSLEAISLFFKGCRSREGGAALLPPQYREAGGYFVFRLFYDSRYLAITLAHPLDRAEEQRRRSEEHFEGSMGCFKYLLRTSWYTSWYEADKQRDGSQDKEEHFEKSMECFKYLLRKYPDAANSLPRPPLLGMIPWQQVSILRQAGFLSPGKPNYLWLVIEAWTKRETRFPRQDLLSYFWFSPMDALTTPGTYDLFGLTLPAHSTIPLDNQLHEWTDDLNLSHMCPSLCWFPLIRFYMMGIISGLIIGYYRLVFLGIFDINDWCVGFLGLVALLLLAHGVLIFGDLSLNISYLIFKKYDRQVWGRLCFLPIILAIIGGLIYWLATISMYGYGTPFSS